MTVWAARKRSRVIKMTAFDKAWGVVKSDKVEDFFDELDRVVSHEDLENAPICPTCNEQVKIRMSGEKSPWASCSCKPDPHPDSSPNWRDE